jgi:hypothetical protein
MNWFALGALFDEFGGTSCKCLACGYLFYFDFDLCENVLETDDGLQPVCPQCGTIGQVQVL